jgi:endonuclease/exonuclease/phosphatase family metal-dependent hydrolase
MLLTVMSVNAQHRAHEEGRWRHLVQIIKSANPDLLMLQEVDWLVSPQLQDEARRQLALSLVVGTSMGLSTAVAWRPVGLSFIGLDTHHSLALHHGYCAPRFDIVGLPNPPKVPLVAISTHLNPYSAQTAAQEAQVVGTRAYRYGGLGLVVGDINHPPVGDPEPDWDTVPPYNRMGRCQRRTHPDDPWRANTVVGQTLADGDFVDVAGHLADARDDLSLRRPTARHGGIRTDQAHVTAPLVPAITDYHQVPTDGYSDHNAIVFTLDLTRIDPRPLREYT